MPENKREEEDILEDETLENDLNAVDETGAEDEIALEEETGETEIADEEAGAEAEADRTGMQMTLNVTDVPQLGGMNPGDEIDLVTTYKIIRGDGDSFDVEAIGFIPTEELESPQEEVPAAPEGGVPPAAGAGLQGLV